MADTESKNQLNAGLRYAGTVGSTALMFAGMMALLSPDQIATVKAQIDVLNQSIITGYGALTKMWVILGPVAFSILGYFGVKSSSVKAIASKLLRIAANVADPSSTEAKVAIVNAAANKDVAGAGAVVVVSPALAANPATANNVVPSVQAARSVT